MEAASGLLRSLGKDHVADNAAGLLRAALAQNARMQGVLQSQMEAEEEALRELHLAREALHAERQKCADLKRTVADLRSQLARGR